MQLKYLIEGLQILQPYYDKPDGYYVGAGHDQFFAYATDRPLSEGAVKRMVELGWFQPDVNIPEDGDGYFKPEHYQPEEGWSAFM